MDSMLVKRLLSQYEKLDETKTSGEFEVEQIANYLKVDDDDETILRKAVTAISFLGFMRTKVN